MVCKAGKTHKRVYARLPRAMAHAPHSANGGHASPCLRKRLLCPPYGSFFPFRPSYARITPTANGSTSDMKVKRAR